MGKYVELDPLRGADVIDPAQHVVIVTKKVPVPDTLSWWDHITGNLLTWAPLLFMALIVFFLWRTMRLIPNTKPVEIKPDSDRSIKWHQVAGADEAQAELQEGV